ncbi:prenyltransferase [Pseudobythopirellula maris]|uniref:Prenyltransferase n=1 Tax=Pseudobythopirellula maris TaxID=2527991 RepID=A0A5C5ZK17_9BACT|nr:UbiA family prenyltransferase [Pseudobythopirellula maris]TWT87387.1 prenyltransferase [Pseudobythopirellula maris]
MSARLSKALAWARLLRISNAPTAAADVWMGYAIATGGATPGWELVWLTLASLCLYSAGMAMNDWFDAEIDAEERPCRPIPSGWVSLRAASATTWTLIACGIVSASLASVVAHSHAPWLCCVMLAIAIWYYNRFGKHSDDGPLALGICRLLNVLVGYSVFHYDSDVAITPDPLVMKLLPVAGIVLYVFGFSSLAHSETEKILRSHLISCSVVISIGLSYYALLPIILAHSFPLKQSPEAWLTLWGVIALMLGRRFAHAVVRPEPTRIQAAVGAAITSIVTIDAALAWGYTGSVAWGAAILALWPLTKALSRFIAQT